VDVDGAMYDSGSGSVDDVDGPRYINGSGSVDEVDGTRCGSVAAIGGVSDACWRWLRHVGGGIAVHWCLLKMVICSKMAAQCSHWYICNKCTILLIIT
jgi:hypothetical protein